ncbi:amphi-Trp domain-containing protein [Thermosulfurimonas dismutans]|uniref:Amphi-Trp domain-containing protein n=1 Tax=Thermosulfurimonas dismutans TaxID=999894 RepID=A0A179D774_9BACT|nr:amphi-Trp domain-containing protein [Thermosulfurimonas dismutans]OAQ21458.1 hypothetical protein TDIS_0679 [Thermosulfurimonas dismutans]
MAEKKVLFKSEEPKDRASVVAFLRDLVNRLEQGKFTFKRGAEEVSIEIPEQVVLEIKVEEKTKPGKNKRSLEIEIEWNEGEKAELTLE